MTTVTTVMPEFMPRRDVADPALEVDAVTVQFGALTAVDEVSLSVRPGSITALIGPNGAGKSTAFNAMTGYVRLQSGRVRMGPVDLTRMRPDRVSQHGVVRSFQKRSVFPAMTVAENLRVGLHRTQSSSLIAAMLGLPSHQRLVARTRERVAAMAELIGLDTSWTRPPRRWPTPGSGCSRWGSPSARCRGPAARRAPRRLNSSEPAEMATLLRGSAPTASGCSSSTT